MFLKKPPNEIVPGCGGNNLTEYMQFHKTSQAENRLGGVGCCDSETLGATEKL